MSVGRNEPCPCGSGQKYKRCCDGKESRQRTMVSKGLIAVVILLVGFAAVGVFMSMRSDGPATPASTRRVWSEEHGHFHDVG